MKYDLYLVLGVCAPVVAFLLIFLIANVVGFLKEHWKKAQHRKFIRNIKTLLPNAASVSEQSNRTPQMELRDYLCEPVNDFPWLRVYTEEENRRGLLALRELARRIRSRRGQLLHCGYLFHIFTAQRALGMGQYSLACHELFDVVEHFQNPETTALIYKMIEPYFDEVTPMEQAAKKKCCPHCGNQCQDEDRYCRICGERLFKGFSELPEKKQGQIIAIVEQFTDAYLADKKEATHNE